MRVVLLSFWFIEYTLQLANALSKSADLLLMLPKNKTERYIQMIDDNVTSYLFHLPRNRYPSNILMLYRIVKRIRSFKPDLIHLQGGHAWFNLVLGFLSRKYTLVITVHDVTHHTGDKDSLKVPSFISDLNKRYADHIIVHGNALKTQLINAHNRAADTVCVIPHGELSVYRKLSKQKENVEQDNDTILFFGRIWEYKGLRYLIEAEPLISKEHPNVKIVIAGSGENFEKYERMFVNKDRFVVHNKFIPHEMVANLFQSASIVVLPYVEASQSGIIPLAYAFSKPVVATNVGSLAEIVDDGKTGYIVPPRDPKALAKAINSLLKDKNKLKAMGQNAYAKTKHDLSWDTIATKTMHVYRIAIGDK